MKIIQSFISSLCVIFHLLILVACYLPFLNNSINPSDMPLLGSITLALPLFLALNLLFSLFWLISRKWSFFILFFFASTGLFKSYTSFLNYTVPLTEKGPSILSCNIQYLKKGPEIIDRMIREMNPDIVLFQESKKEKINNLESLEEQGYHQVNFPYLTFLSKYPIEYSQEVLDNKSNGHVAFIDIQINGKPLRIFNVYLEPFHLVSTELELVSSNKQHLKNQIKNMQEKLSVGFKKHSQQLPFFNEYLSTTKSIIVAGDLNSVPFSYEYLFFRKKLHDLFIEAGTGLSFSYTTYTFPLRIDYFFGSSTIKANHYKVLDYPVSDHQAIFTHFHID